MIVSKTKQIILFVIVVLFTVTHVSFAQTSVTANGSIVFISNRTGTYQVYTINPNGTNLSQVTDDEEDTLYVSCSADGRYIATTGDAHWGIRIIDIQTLDSTLILQTPDIYESLSWFPSGDRLAFVSTINGGFDIFIVDIDGSNLYQVTDTRARENSISISPDNLELVYSAVYDDHTGISQIHLADFSEITLTINTQGLDDAVYWSPIDQEILFTSDEDELQNYGIYIIDSVTSLARAITDLQTIDWLSSFSPKKDKIAFNSSSSGNPDIYTMNLDGSNRYKLTSDPAIDLNGCWLPLIYDPSIFLPSSTLSPISDTTNTTATFTWSSVSGTELYLLSVSSTNTLIQESFVVSNVCNAMECSTTLSQPLTPDTYTASVQGSNASATSEWSNVETFAIFEPCDHSIPTGDITGLITAINSANADPDATSICLSAGTYTFTASNNPDNALPIITSDVTITGNGATFERNATEKFRFLQVTAGHLTLEDLMLTGGDVSGQGGAIRVNGASSQLTLDGVTLTGNTSSSFGGGLMIIQNASGTIQNSTLTLNTSATKGGGMTVDRSDVTIIDSTISQNTSSGVYSEVGNITFIGSDIIDNYVANSGAGINNWYGTLTVDDSTIADNLVHVSSGVNGGGIYSNNGTVTITNSVFSGNFAHNDGGGLGSREANLTLTNTVFVNNQADDDAGAIYLDDTDTILIQYNRIQSNSAGDDGDAFAVTGSDIPITYNCLALNGVGVQRLGGTVYMQNNWWGSADGPGISGADSIQGTNVNYQPFLTSEPVECPPLPPQPLTLVQTPASSAILQRQTEIIPIPASLILEDLWADVTDTTRRNNRQTLFEYGDILDLREYQSPLLEIQSPVNVSKRNDLDVQVETEDGTWESVRVTESNGVYQVDLSAYVGELIWLRLGVPETELDSPASQLTLIEQ